MNTFLKDTHQKADQVLIDLLQNATHQRKINLVAMLSEQVTFLAKRAIKRANPDLSQQELDLLFVRFNYGAELEARLRKYLDRLKNE